MPAALRLWDTDMKEVTLTAEQERACSLIEEWFFNRAEQSFVLSGYAGTGKTFLINYAVRERLHLVPDQSVQFATPTGKAATVLIRGGTPASTIHALIYHKEEEEEHTVNEDGEVVINRKLKFKKRTSIDAEIKLIVIDEVSMVSDEVLRDILSFGVKCLFTGDGAQLPPISGSNSLLDRPDFTLTEIVRQEEDNPIVKIATMIRNGVPVPYGSYGEDVCVYPRRKFTGSERKRILLAADQIIVGTNRTRAAVNRELREYLGTNRVSTPVSGEKVICTLNNWDKCIDYEEKFHLVNGIIGYCTEVRVGSNELGMFNFRAEFLEDEIFDVPFDCGIFTQGRYLYDYGDEVCLLEDGRLVSKFEGKRNKEIVEEVVPLNRFEFAYAITCHKSQGSEFDCVVVFDESYAFEEREKWLYTAVTRAKKRLLLIR